MKRLSVTEETSRLLERLGLEPGYVVVTVHRVESVDDLGRLSRIAHLVAGLAGRARVAFPAHPRTRKRLNGDGPVEGAAVQCFSPLTFMHDRCPSARRSKAI
jgi:UDP-N-acetylglucosamine 2-epimerase